jgi:hypothetical protein
MGGKHFVVIAEGLARYMPVGTEGRPLGVEAGNQRSEASSRAGRGWMQPSGGGCLSRSGGWP